MIWPLGAPGRLRCLTLLALLAGAVILSGCARIEIGIHVNEDGSGEIALLSALDTRFLDAAAAAGDTGIKDPFSGLDEAGLPPGATVEEYDQDGFRGVRARFPFAASEDIKRTIDAALSDAGDDPTGAAAGLDQLFERFDLRRDGDGWRFDAVAVPLFMGALPGDGGDALGGDALGRRDGRTDAGGVRVHHPDRAAGRDRGAQRRRDRGRRPWVWSLDPLAEEPARAAGPDQQWQGQDHPARDHRGRGGAAGRGHHRRHLAQVTPGATRPAPDASAIAEYERRALAPPRSVSLAVAVFNHNLAAVDASWPASAPPMGLSGGGIA